MPSEHRPNILLVTTDQQRFDTVAPDAPAVLRMPHLQRLQAEGTTFTRAYADNPICVPSRVALMTGRTVRQHGMLNNGATSDVMGHDDTLPRRLAAAGYQTAAIGKMHFTPPRARHGFGETIVPDDYYHERLRSGGAQPMRHGLGQNELYPALSTVPEAETLTAWISDRACDHIMRRRDPTLPFFLWVSYSKPHPPLDPPEPYYSMYDPDDLPAPIVSRWQGTPEEPETLRRQRDEEFADHLTPELLQAARAAYAGLVTQIDYNFGRVLAALADSGQLDDTFILFTSDHGEFLGDHGLVQKVQFHEPSARVPLVICPPASWQLDHQRGRFVDTPVTLGDVTATLIAVAGGQPLDNDEVCDLLPFVVNPRPATRVRYVDGMSAGYHADSDQLLWLGITDGTWKYIWFPEGPAEQLFNLAEDPQELVNRIGDPQAAATADALRARLVAAHERRGSPYVRDGRLCSRPVAGDTLGQRRARGWAGYHTELSEPDTKH